MLVIFSLVLLAVTDPIGARSAYSSEKEPMVAVLDAVEQMMTGQEDKFDRTLYDRVKICLKSLGPVADDTHNSIYQGIMSLWKTNGLPGDRWGSYNNGYNEFNATVTTLNGMTVQEPCNAASNIPYYFTLLELFNAAETGELTCLGAHSKPLLRSLAYLMPTSLLHHTAGMAVGIKLDIKIIEIITYLIHQASLAGIPYDPVIHDLSTKPRRRSSIEYANDIQEMYLNERVASWGETIKKIDVPSRYQSIGAFIGSSLSANINPIILRIIAPSLARTFGIPDEDYDFLIHNYLPKVSKVFSELENDKRKPLFKDTVSSLAKFGYAFLWISDMGTETSRGTFGSILNFIGSKIIPALNFKLNILNSFDHSFRNLQLGRHLYPGEKKCNIRYPHAKWHVQSAVSIVDTVKLAADLCLQTESRK